MTDTIVAQASAPGEAAVGVVRLSGPGSVGVAARFLRGRVPFERAEARRAGLWRAVEVEGGREAFLDEVVAVVYRAPASYTGEDLVELFAHGSPYILERLAALSAAAGARPARPGEFTLRAFLNGKLDLSQAEGVAALIRARTKEAHRAAAVQFGGGVSALAKSLRERTIALLALYEAELDHGDEGIPAVDPRQADAAFAALEGELERQCAAARSGRFLDEGLRVAIVGPPNAGKSSLLNALLGRERAIVLDEPGTTRDTLQERAELDGVPVTLLDTAGLRRRALDAAERLGMERAREALSRADVALCVMDASRPGGDEERAALEQIARESRAGGCALIGVYNKMDLCAAPVRRGEFEEAVAVSAKERTGLDELSRAVARRALPAGEETLARANARHGDVLRRVKAAVASARGLASRGRSEELVAAELREALSALGEIAGETRADDILAAVFSKFCVGK